jgi:hypothetical protein
MKNILITIIFLGILPSSSISQTITTDFYPEKDNSIFSDNINNSNGAGLNIFAGKTLQNTNRRGLVKFDISSIPANVQIDNASLQMAVIRSSGNSSTEHSFTIHKTLQNWGEGTSNGLGSGDAAQGNDATWQYSLFSSSTPWTTQGGNFVATASATASVGFSQFPVNFGVWSSTTVKNDVESWVNTPSNNFGWTIVGDENTAGSAKGFGSREQIAAYRPKLTITYTLPIVDKILINEVNPSKKWIEFYNPSANPVNLANYWIVNGASSANIGGGNVSVLNGNLLLNSGKYAVVAWTNLGQSTGEIALFNKNPTDNTAIMKDYVQYGAGSQSKAAAAVTAQVWNNATAFLQANITTNTYSLNPTGNYMSGQETDVTSWLVQKQTPSYKNEICPATLTLSSSLIDDSYQSSGQLNATGSVSSTSNIKLRSATAIVLEDLFEINKGAVFEAKIGGCIN